MSRHLIWFVATVLLSGFSLWVALPNVPAVTNVPESCKSVLAKQNLQLPAQGVHIDTNDDCLADINLNVQQSLGLDLVGGLRVLLQAQLPPGSFTAQDLAETANGVSQRINGLGLSEATVQVQGSNRILVELPGVTDPKQAIDTIQQTALLEFVDFSNLGAQAQQLTGHKVLTTQQILIQQQRAQAQAASESTPSPDATAEATAEATTQPAAQAASQPPVTATPTTPQEQPVPNPLTGQPFTTVITGADLQAAAAQYSTTKQGGVPEWQVEFQLKAEGATKFGEFTGAHIGQPLAIVLDGTVLSAPTIQSQLTDKGTITGNFTEESAKKLALQLRSGALRVPLSVESSEEVGATLGQESVTLSIRAGVIGVIVVLLFMLVDYRVPGIAADLALIVFILLNLAVFKLIPITLTLPSIVGFLISIGSAVDGNILIFERLREELRRGSDVDTAIEAGFSRAWASIRDSHISTILICGVLFLFGQSPGASIVSGFAVTLTVGLVLNLFTAITVTRTFLHLVVGVFRNAVETRAWLLGV
jgi:protein-export membrane protein SecD